MTTGYTRDPEHWKTHCPWCGRELTELTGRCYCGREPPKPAALPPKERATLQENLHDRA